MDDSREFYTLHLPQLVAYVVPVMQSKSGKPQVGSGVLVKAGNRHFVATAEHCMNRDVHAAVSTNPFIRSGSTGMRRLHILNRGWHDSLDIGYLEIENPQSPELDWDQLSNDRITGGNVQVVGYPEVLTEWATAMPGKITDLSLCPGTFSTTLKAETTERMTLDYPRVGIKYDPATGEWSDSPFPETPRGFSGGAIFGVEKKAGIIERTEYKLLGVQYSWNEVNSVFAVPIKRWKELLVERGLVTR